MGTRKDWLQRAALVLGAGLFLAALGPFGTADAPLLVRAVYWPVAVAFGLACAETADAFLRRAVPGRTPVWVRGLVLSVAITPPIALGVGAADWLMGGRVRWEELPVLLASVWVISAGMTALGLLVHTAGAAGAAGAAKGAKTGDGGVFAGRLPPRLRAAELWALNAEDHYLRVRTAEGDTLILMRLSDAEAELSDLPGLRVHRSWWVAERGVEAVRSQPGGRAVIRIKDGAEAPVSRTYRPALKEAGWL